MNRTILYIAESLDGFIAGKDDDLSWLEPYAGKDHGFNEFLSTIGAIIVGRRTHDIEVAHGWDNAHLKPTFVVTHRGPGREPRRKDIFFTSEDIAEIVKKAKAMTQKDIWLEGGADLARQFLERKLIDEIVVSIIPVIMGEGTPLFDDLEMRLPLTLRRAKHFDGGIVQLVYIPAVGPAPQQGC